MTVHKLTDELQDFIVLCIPSIPFLEAILLMRNDSEQDWNACRLAQALYVDEARAMRLLQELHQAEVLVPSPGSADGYRYAPLSPVFSRQVELLADLYQHHVVQISKLIHSRDQPGQAA